MQRTLSYARREALLDFGETTRQAQVASYVTATKPHFPLHGSHRGCGAAVRHIGGALEYRRLEELANTLQADENRAQPSTMAIVLIEFPISTLAPMPHLCSPITMTCLAGEQKHDMGGWMAGCRTLGPGRQCGSFRPAPLSPTETRNRALARSFIEIWNDSCQIQDPHLGEELERGNDTYLPNEIASRLEAVLSPNIRRIRYDQNGSRIVSVGTDDYKRCINAVRSVVDRFSIGIDELLSVGSTVSVRCTLRGVSRRLDGRPDQVGAFGELPTHNEFRVSDVYLILSVGRSGKITSDELSQGGAVTQT